MLLFSIHYNRLNFFIKGVDVSVCATNVNMTISLPGYVDVLVQVNAKTGLFVVTSTALCVQLTGKCESIVFCPS